MFKAQKETWKENFFQIVDGQSSVTTRKGALQIFGDVYNSLTSKLLTAQRTTVRQFLCSPEVLAQFDTNTVYDELERLYVKSPKLCEYTKQMDYMKDPVPYFNDFAVLLEELCIFVINNVALALFH